MGVRLHTVLILGCWLSRCAFGADASAANEWRQWRGPEFNGVASHSKPPIEWSESKNIRWKVAIPGDGLSVPLVWNNLVIVQTAIPSGKVSDDEATKPDESQKETPAPEVTAPEVTVDRQDGDGRRSERGDAPPGERRGGRNRGPDRRPAPSQSYKFNVIALDRRTGETVWQRTVCELVPHEGSHGDGSLAPASPVTDGKHIFAYFGSRGLYGLDMQGNVVWEKDLGDMKTRNGFGEGSSPALAGDTLVVNWDHEGDSFIVALDAKSGKERWRKDRDEATSWSTPLMVKDGDTRLAIVSGSNRIRAYELDTGKVRWECGGLGSNCVPCPVERHGKLIVMSGHREPALVAINYLGATGDLTGTERVSWSLDGGTPYVPSPLLYDDTLYFLQKNTGLLSCYDPDTGRPHFEKQRLEKIKGVYASPVGADGRVYIAGRGGITDVLKRGPEFQVLATNELDDQFDTSPAIAGNELYLRGRQHLYCIAED
jgi:outer membrane protein assembly factor BamB